MRTRNPLAPVQFVTTFVLAFAGIFLLVGIVSSVLDPSHSSFGPEACVTVTNGNYTSYVHRITSSDPSYQRFLQDAPMATPPVGTRASIRGVELCAAHPSAGQRAWAWVGWSAGFLFFLGSVGLTWLLARRARKDGFFVAATSRGLSRIGGFLLVGTVVEHLVEWVGAHELLASLVPPGNPTWNGIGSLASPTMLIVGAGVLTLGRVMAYAVAMQDELDVTV